MPWTKGNGPPTKFRPGQSGNPYGRPPSKFKELVELAKGHTPEAISRILEIMRQHDDDELALQAAVELFNRGWSKPPVAVLAHISGNGQLPARGIVRPPLITEEMDEDGWPAAAPSSPSSSSRWPSRPTRRTGRSRRSAEAAEGSQQPAGWS